MTRSPTPIYSSSLLRARRARQRKSALAPREKQREERGNPAGASFYRRARRAGKRRELTFICDISRVEASRSERRREAGSPFDPRIRSVLGLSSRRLFDIEARGRSGKGADRYLPDARFAIRTDVLRRVPPTCPPWPKPESKIERFFAAPTEVSLGGAGDLAKLRGARLGSTLLVWEIRSPACRISARAVASDRRMIKFT